MIIKKEVEKLIKEKVIEEIICNKCGCVMSMKMFDYVHMRGTEVVMDFGYGSVNDDDQFKFHLCDDCVKELIESFKCPPEINCNMLFEPIENAS